MSDLWLKFACFLIGYKYAVVKNFSLATELTAKKYLSALLLLCLIWGFIGYSFVHRYISQNPSTIDGQAIIGAFIMVFVVIQIERQIILSFSKSKAIKGLRIFLGTVMAFLGSCLTDSILFDKDIKTADKVLIQNEVDSLFKKKQANEQLQIDLMRSSISELNKLRDSATYYGLKNPVITFKNRKTTRLESYMRVSPISGLAQRDSARIETQENSGVENPGFTAAKGYNTAAVSLDSSCASILKKWETERQKIEAEVKADRGFLTELKALENVLFHPLCIEAIAFWLVFFSAVFTIELLIVFIKMNDTENDYEIFIQRQLRFKTDQIEGLLSNT